MTSEPLFRFYLFGSPRLVMGRNTVSLPPQPLSLFAYLLLNRERRITREEVQAAFWPDAAPASAQERLRRALYLLRQAIQPHTHLIVADNNELAIAPDANIWVDYTEFERLLVVAYRHERPSCQDLQQAVALYKDDLLKNIYADWALLEREQARQQFLNTLRDLVLVAQGSANWGELIRHAHLLLKYDPLQETAHQALMMAYSATGDRSAAIRQYQQCVRLLRDELGVEPLDETIRLFETIRQGHSVAPSRLTFSPGFVASPVAAY
jgi:DNA-binding SARP family transcriptional activator